MDPQTPQIPGLPQAEPGPVEQVPLVTEDLTVYRGSRLAAKIRQMKLGQAGGVLSLAVIVSLGAGLLLLSNRFSGEPIRSQAAASPTPSPSPSSTPSLRY